MSYEGAAAAADPGGPASLPAAGHARPGDDAALFERWQRHRDQQAREQLVSQYMPLARKLALRYLAASEPVDDLVQVANLALLKAIDRFDARRGMPFGSFAVPTILGELKRHFRDNGWAVHVPREVKEKALRVQNTTRQLVDELGRVPSVLQVAQYLGWEVDEVLAALQAGEGLYAKSLDAPLEPGGDDTVSLGEFFGEDDAGLAHVDSKLAFEASIRVLPALEHRVVVLRFTEGLPQTEIAERLGVSQMQVSRLLRSALSRLREAGELTE